MTQHLKTHFALALILTTLTACADRPDMDTARLADKNKDYATSVRHYQELSDFGIPEAKVQLAKHYLQGKGVPQDPQRAYQLLNEAEKNGMGDRIAKDVNKAKVQMGTAALAGKLRAVPPAQGVSYLQDAADNGDARAIFELGNAYDKGIGVPQNVALALKYYEQAGAMGYGRADYNRAMLYEKGKSVPQNIPLALSLYESAAEKSYPKANLNLAKIYENGIGVKPDTQLAQAYYSKAEADLDKK